EQPAPSGPPSAIVARPASTPPPTSNGSHARGRSHRRTSTSVTARIPRLKAPPSHPPSWSTRAVTRRQTSPSPITAASRRPALSRPGATPSWTRLGTATNSQVITPAAGDTRRRRGPGSVRSESQAGTITAQTARTAKVDTVSRYAATVARVRQPTSQQQAPGLSDVEADRVRRRVRLLVDITSRVAEYRDGLRRAADRLTRHEATIIADLEQHGLDVTQLREVLWGGHVLVDDPDLYEAWRFPKSRERLSSHHKSVDKETYPDLGLKGPLVREK